jgi:hypothetical protein
MRRLRPDLLLAAVLTVATMGCRTHTSASPQAASPEIADPMLASYVEIGDRLAADRLDGVGELARELEQSAAERAGEPGVDELRAATERLDTADIEGARAAYRDSSLALLRVLEHDPAAREGLTLMYCPRVFDGAGGYWVQRGKKVRNPYFGSRWLRCGSVVAWDRSR